MRYVCRAEAHSHKPQCCLTIMLLPTIPQLPWISDGDRTGKVSFLTFLTTWIAEQRLKLPRPFHLDIPPSPTTTQQSVTINLPSTHFFLRIRPTLAPSLSSRPNKLFVTSNMQRLNPIPERPEDTHSRKPLYEARVTTGSINRIEIEIVAGTPRGVPKVGNGPDVEVEKITLFVNLTKG